MKTTNFVNNQFHVNNLADKDIALGVTFFKKMTIYHEDVPLIQSIHVIFVRKDMNKII